MNRPVLSVLIPAAGASRRLGQAKQLVKYRGISLIQNAIELADSVTPAEIIVVTGANEEAVKAAVQHPPTRWIHNPNWSSGMGGSIALGAASISPNSTGLMILLCDQWRISTHDLQNLTAAWQANPERIVVAEVNGKYMPPVIFPSNCFSALRLLRGDQGARKVLDTYPGLLSSVPMENAAFDLDTQAQLQMLETTQAG